MYIKKMEFGLLFIFSTLMYASCEVAVTNESEIGKRSYDQPKYVKVSVQIEYPEKQETENEKKPESTDLKQADIKSDIQSYQTDVKLGYDPNYTSDYKKPDYAANPPVYKPDYAGDYKPDYAGDYKPDYAGDYKPEYQPNRESGYNPSSISSNPWLCPLVGNAKCQEIKDKIQKPPQEPPKEPFQPASNNPWLTGQKQQEEYPKQPSQSGSSSPGYNGQSQQGQPPKESFNPGSGNAWIDDSKRQDKPAEKPSYGSQNHPWQPPVQEQKLPSSPAKEPPKSPYTGTTGLYLCPLPYYPYWYYCVFPTNNKVSPQNSSKDKPAQKPVQEPAYDDQNVADLIDVRGEFDSDKGKKQ